MAANLELIRKNVELIRPDFDKLNLTGLNFFKEVEFACQILAKNDYLAGANPQSIQNSVKNVAMTGLSLNPVLKYCYLIPRKEKVNGTSVLCCIAEPSYIGLCKVLTDTNSVIAISSTMVYEKEIATLKIQEGAGGHASHTPYFAGHPGKPMACYTKAILPSGVEFIGLLRPFQWEEIMKRSESVKSYNTKQAKGEYAAVPTWISDLDEMIRKTAIKNIYKYLPKSERAEMVGNVIHLDNEANGIDFENKENYNQDPDQEQKGATPDAPAEDAMATDSDYKEIIDMLVDPILADVKLFNGEDKLTRLMMHQGIYKRIPVNGGAGIEKSKADEYITFLKKQIEYFTANPVAKTEEGAKGGEA